MGLILASTSRYRAELLKRLELPFETCAPEVDETPQPEETAAALVVRLSRAKAQAGARTVGNGAAETLVIGSDQVAVVDGDILGKPGDEARARAQLARLSGREVKFLTGLCVVNPDNGRIEETLVETPVKFRDLTPGEIADYVAREQPLDCAGAFKSEGLGIALFEEIGGTDPNALIGLPLIALCSLLRNHGWRVLGR
jgi:septum formation protein